jgi:hypothetical protein
LAATLQDNLKFEMANKIGELVSFRYSDRPTPIYGIVVDYNQDWTLLKHNPFDYIIDGYIILRHKNLLGYRRDSEEKFREKVIKLKKLHYPDIPLIPLTNLETILTHLSNKYEVIDFELKSEKACYLGKVKSITSSELKLKFLDPKGIWRNQMKFRSNDIRTIKFKTDYIESLKLISKSK